MTQITTRPPIFGKVYDFSCSTCTRTMKVEANSKLKARIFLHSIGWSSTSMDSQSAKDWCDGCMPTVKAKRSSFVLLGYRLGRRSGV